ncbi:MAG TPA: DegV family protein [Acidimicrobiales bacterium]|nr:DegV family protein [Acidimicrobiales bacterium]
MSVTVVTDSSASLPEEAVRSLGVTVVPLNLVLGGISYRDGDLDPGELTSRSATEHVSTSSPSPGDFLKGIEDHDEGLGCLVITVSSKMSGTFEAARIASSYFDSGTVRVLDSGTAAGAQGLIVMEAAELARSGASLDEVAALAERVASRVHLIAALENLDHLARSGRVPGAAAWAGRSLGVRALFEFSRGRVRPRIPAIGTRAVFDRIVEAVGSGESDSSILKAAVLHSDAPERAADLRARVASAHPGAEMFVAPFSSVMVAHTGPGLIGLAWWWDEEVEYSTASLSVADGEF